MVRSRILCLMLLALVASAIDFSHASAATLLVEFTSPTCGPCRSMRPVLRRLARDGYAIREVDVTQHPAIARQYNVDRWPTFLVLVDGREHARLVGATSQAELVEMVGKSEAIAASHARGETSRLDVKVVPVGNSQTSATRTFANGPGGERIVDIEPAKSGLSRPKSAPAADAPSSSSDSAASHADLIAATVRLSVEDPDGRSNGTGTIVDAREGEALVLTCGHLFRESAGKGRIEITLYRSGPQGAEEAGSAEGILMNYDLERDLAVVRFVTDRPVVASRVAAAGTAPAKGAVAASVGCDGGAKPTVWPTRVTAVDRFMGHPNIEAARAPVEGRSGGGLFDDQGQLIGVCYASDHEGDEGLYASLPSIHAKLNEMGLKFVYDQPASDRSLAAARAPEHIAIRGQSPTAAPLAAETAPPPATWGRDAIRSPTQTPTLAEPATGAVGLPMREADTLTAAERATLEELELRRQEAEVICIIRPLASGSRSEVVKLDKASPALVRAIKTAGAPTDNGAEGRGVGSAVR